MKIQSIPLSKIVLDPSLQARVQLDMETIREYAERIHEGDAFPSVDVMDVDGTFYLVDGWHRYHAYQAEGCEEIDASIVTGTFSDAVLAAAKSNKANSLKRTSADKRRAVSLLLADGTWKAKSSNWIASELGVSVDLVCRMRAEDERLSESDSQERVGKDGRTYRTENIGRKAEKPSLKERPTTTAAPYASVKLDVLRQRGNGHRDVEVALQSQEDVLRLRNETGGTPRSLDALYNLAVGDLVLDEVLALRCEIERLRFEHHKDSESYYRHMRDVHLGIEEPYEDEPGEESYDDEPEVPGFGDKLNATLRFITEMVHGEPLDYGTAFLWGVVSFCLECVRGAEPSRTADSLAKDILERILIYQPDDTRQEFAISIIKAARDKARDLDASAYAAGGSHGA